MRYWEIIISNPTTGEVLVPNFAQSSTSSAASAVTRPGYNNEPATTDVYVQSSYGSTRNTVPQITSTYSSLYPGMVPAQLGSSNPAALLVDLDVPVTFMHAPDAQAQPYIRISGVSLQEVNNAQALNGMNIQIRGGMAKGLPLANPAQAGVLTQGQVWQAYGTWTGTEQSITIYLTVPSSTTADQQLNGYPGAVPVPVPVTNESPANIVFTWSRGMHLETAVASALSIVFPAYVVRGALNPGLIWTGDQAEIANFSTLQQFAQYLNSVSQRMVNGPTGRASGYPGVSLSLENSAFTLSDGTQQTKPLAIAFRDLMGQPAWVAPFTVQMQCPMRADIQVGDYVTLPAGQFINTPNSGSQFYATPPNNTGNAVQDKNSTIFNGTFWVLGVRHVGNSRSPQGQAWVTVFDLLQATPDTATNVVDALPMLYNGRASYNFYLPG